MTITASICTDIYAMIFLCIIIWLANRNPIGNKYNNKIYKPSSEESGIEAPMEAFILTVFKTATFNRSRLTLFKLSLF